jgi:hypothetical protein
MKLPVCYDKLQRHQEQCRTACTEHRVTKNLSGMFRGSRFRDGSQTV